VNLDAYVILAQPSQAYAAGQVCGVVVCIGAGLIIPILFLVSMQRALQCVSPVNRTMEPGLVWLMMVPGLGFIWQFFVAARVPDSLRQEFRSRGIPERGDFGKGAGLIFCCLVLVLLVTECVLDLGQLGKQPDEILRESNLQPVICIRLIVLLAMLVLGILFWTRVVGARRRLEMVGDNYYDPFSRDFGDYDRPFPSGGPETPPDTYRPDEPGRHE
jgi:hypothetical protein